MGLSFAAPLAGRDTDGFFAWVDYDPFQSTRPLRGATSYVTCSPYTAAFQSTRPLRGATLIKEQIKMNGTPFVRQVW